jgi:hypothetical protein
MNDVTVTLTERSTELSGTVRDPDGRVVERVRVVVFPRAEADRQRLPAPAPPRIRQLLVDRSGRFQSVELEDTPKKALTDFTVVLTPMYPWQREEPRVAVVNQSGAFAVQGVAPGRYRISVSIAGNLPDDRRWSVKSVVVDGRNRTDQPLSVGPDESISHAVLTLTRLEQDISGVVRDTSNQPVTAVTIVLFPADPELWSVPQRIAIARPATDGQFRFTGLPTGDFRMIALLALDPDQLNDRAFLQSLLTSSMPVRVGPGEKKVLELRARTPRDATSRQ